MRIGFSNWSGSPEGVVGVWTGAKRLGGKLSPHLEPVIQSPRVYAEVIPGLVLMATTRGLVSPATGARLSSLAVASATAWLARPKTEGA